MFDRDKKLNQSGGTDSTNTQAGRDVVIVQGNSLSEVRDFVREAISANALAMRQIAREVIEERISTFSELLMERAKSDPELVSATADPDMQHALIDAGLGFARSGDEDMAGILVDLLADRSKEESRSLLALVINDAVTIAPRLTDGEIAILTIYWRLAHTINYAVTSSDALAAFVKTDIAPLVPFLPSGDANYLHLQSLGCAVVQISEIYFQQVWNQTYTALFTQGFTLDEIPEAIHQPLVDSSLLVQHMRDPTRLQINVLNEQQLRAGVAGQAIEAHVEDIVNFMKSRPMQSDELIEHLAQIDPVMRDLAAIWASTSLRYLRLSAVGIAIAHANWRHLTGMTAPLSTWISETGPS
ncbi:MAG TPA: LPO_1073/Vpar_1526 family protein [Jatrophihabitans sp.]|nr:LPO_1073/Vpar_1526 family protein [Jatrophihabitans sp.]